MKFRWRVAVYAAVMVGVTSGFTACQEETSGGEDPPRTTDDILAVTGTGAASVAVLANDTNLVNEPLTYAIDESPTVGSASFNSDNTVRLDLPSGFHGVTRFKYKVTNSLGGFSVSTAAVFVDVPAYRALYAAQSGTQPAELYINDFVSEKKISQAGSGNFRLQNLWRSESGALIAYERSDSPQSATASELYYVRTTPVASPVKIERPAGRNFLTSSPLAFSGDDRWIAFATSPTSTGGRATDLYVFDTNGSSNAVAVGDSNNLLPNLTVWSDDGSALYFMAAPNATGVTAIYRVATGSFDSPQRVSPLYPASSTSTQLVVSPDESKLLIVGTHNGQAGVFYVDPTDTTTERRLTTDVPNGATIESIHVKNDFTEVLYLWRSGTATNARLSAAAIDATGNPRIVLESDITAFSEIKPDDSAALITRRIGSSTSDGTLYEVLLDGSGDNVRITPNVTSGVYDDTGDVVYLFSNTIAPAVLARNDFERTPSPLVRSNTSPTALYITPTSAPYAAIVQDTTAGLVLVNSSAPGKTLKLTDLTLVSSTTLFPWIIKAAQ